MRGHGPPPPFFPAPPPLPRFIHGNGVGEVDWGKHGGFFSGGSVVETATPLPSTLPYPTNNGFSSAFAQSIFPPPPPLAPMPGPSAPPGGEQGMPPPPPLTELERMLQTAPRQSHYENSFGDPLAPNIASSTSMNSEDPLQIAHFEDAHLPPPINQRPTQSFLPDGRPQNLPSSFEQETGVSEASLAGMLGESAVQPSQALARKGVSIKELRVPRDMEIATNSQQPPVKLSMGQRVMIIKTPKGVYLRLGAKVIKIRLPEELLKSSSNNGSDEVVTLSGDEEGPD